MNDWSGLTNYNAKHSCHLWWLYNSKTIQCVTQTCAFSDLGSLQFDIVHNRCDLCFAANMLSYTLVCMLISSWDLDLTWIQSNSCVRIRNDINIVNLNSNPVYARSVFATCAQVKLDSTELYIVYTIQGCSFVSWVEKIIWHLLQKVHVNICSCI